MPACLHACVPACPSPAPQVPFSTFEEVLQRPENRQLASDLAAAVKAVTPAAAGQQLARCRELVMQVGRPAGGMSTIRPTSLLPHP